MDLVIFADLCPTSHHSMGHNPGAVLGDAPQDIDRKSTRLNSSHVRISYAVFCLKKKNKNLMERDSAAPARVIIVLYLNQSASERRPRPLMFGLRAASSYHGVGRPRYLHGLQIS